MIIYDVYYIEICHYVIGISFLPAAGHILRAASFRSTDCSDTTRQQTLQGTTRPTTAGCRSSDVSMPLGERFQVGFMLLTPKCGKKHGEKTCFF